MTGPVSESADDRRLEWVFAHELARQARIARRAVGEIDQVVRDAQIDGIPRLPDFERFWVAVQTFLGSAAMMSKILWATTRQKGITPEMEARRGRLRRRLNVVDSSPVNDKQLRNDFEHFDERLEQWWVEDDRHNIIDESWIPSSSRSPAFHTTSYMRLYDQETGVVSVFDHEVNIGELYRAVIEIGDRAQTLADSRPEEWAPEP